MSTLKIFRIIAFLEGVSYLLLMCASVYKRTHGDDSFVRLLGMPHGLLFVAYVALAILLQSTYKWNFKSMAIIIAGSLIPFGTFYVDHKYLKPLA